MTATQITRASIGLMLDLETLGNGPNAAVWQSALYGWDLTDPSTILPLPHFQYLPVPPQLRAPLNRQVNFSTLQFWFKEIANRPSLVEDFNQCESADWQDLSSLVNHFINAFNRFTDEGRADYELWYRGNFDIPIMGTLIESCGFAIPWDFRKLMDLRTLERASGISYKTVDQPKGFIKHRADWDCLFQIEHHTACMKALGAGK